MELLNVQTFTPTGIVDEDIKLSKHLRYREIRMLDACVICDIQLDRIDIDWRTQTSSGVLSFAGIPTAHQYLMIR